MHACNFTEFWNIGNSSIIIPCLSENIHQKTEFHIFSGSQAYLLGILSPALTECSITSSM